MKIIVAINNSHCIGNNNSLIIENKEDLKLFNRIYQEIPFIMDCGEMNCVIKM